MYNQEDRVNHVESAHRPIPTLLSFHTHSSYSKVPLLKTKISLYEQSCISGYKCCSCLTAAAAAASLGEIVPLLLLVVFIDVVAVRDESVMLL